MISPQSTSVRFALSGFVACTFLSLIACNQTAVFPVISVLATPPVASSDEDEKNHEAIDALPEDKKVTTHSTAVAAKRPLRIMLDAVHSNTWIATPPQPDCHDYHTLHGLARGVGLLRQLGHDIRLQLVAPWRQEDLDQCDAIILNLVSMDRPPFLVSEIERVKRFLENGGGMLIITDHSNCYYHGHMLMPLLDSLDVKMPLVTACDQKPFAIGQGNGWICIDDFVDHPITQGLKHVAFQSGGCVDPRFGVAWTSKNSWGDLNSNPRYAEGGNPGLYGDFIQTAFEPKGKQAVILGKSVGKGRLAIIADQNALGGMYLSYADNRQLWIQAVSWVGGLPIESTLAATEIPDEGKNIIWCYEPLGFHEFRFGSDEGQALYNLYGWLTRYYDARAREKPVKGTQLAIISIDDLFSKPDVSRDRVKQMLQDGMHVVAIVHADRASDDGVLGMSAKEADLAAIVQELAMQPVSGDCEIVSAAYEAAGIGKLILISDRDLTNERFSVPEKKPGDEQQAIEAQFIRLLDKLVPAFRPQEIAPTFRSE